MTDYQLGQVLTEVLKTLLLEKRFNELICLKKPNNFAVVQKYGKS